MRQFKKLRSFILVLVVLTAQIALSQSAIKGVVIDKKYKEPLTGAAIMIQGTTNGTTADIDGNYEIKVAPGKYTIVVSYVSYTSQTIQNVVVESGKPTVVNINMEEASLMLESVQVVAQMKTDTELSLLKSVRTAVQVVNGISSQQIGKTLDRDASEVVKRVPGVTIQDNRFIVVRGLNQRYNNVWLNNAATPSSETDVKAFSFDVIPSNMIDNLLIYKTGSPELAAEATGGFIKISTKNIPDENFLNIEYGIAYNEVTTFKDAYFLPSKSLDFLGFGNYGRSLPSDFPASLNTLSQAKSDENALKLSNEWVAQRMTALPNQKIGVGFGKKWNLAGGARIGSITSINYSNSYSTRDNMKNYTYERVDPVTETPTYDNKLNVGVYTNDYKIGVLHNWAYQTAGGTKIEFKNLFNQIGVDKTANSYGWNNYRGQNYKYYNNQYSSRTTYSGQLSGDHKIKNADQKKLDWNLGYAYANRIEPDRQNWSTKESVYGSDVYEFNLPGTASINELGRLYMTNHEHVGTFALNYEHKFFVADIFPTVKAGTYNEYKTRNFSERSFAYKKEGGLGLNDSQINEIDFETLFTANYLGRDKVLKMEEHTNKANAYQAQNLLNAAYLSVNLPVGMLNINGGVRAEYNLLTLQGFKANSPIDIENGVLDLFPSLNTSFSFNEKSLVRLAYARSINRPEFRELAPLTYYDFTDKSSLYGNERLKDALIHNVDVRFEHYPTPTETYTLAAFYKDFTNPIEMVSVGANSIYSFANALGATNIGLELEVKKNLGMIGLRNFNVNLNASLIKSVVDFEDKESERSRALQGQSPYVLNTGLYYQNDKHGISSSLMYNVMGKRIVIAAEINQGQVVIPDIYEMPRHVVDFTFNKKVGKNIELKFGLKDLLAQDYRTQQTYEYMKDGEQKSMVLENRVYNLGRTWSFGVNWKL